MLSFLGGAGTVTGSRFLVEAPGARVLVDCGLFQGLKELRLRNWDPFPVDPASIDAVVLTHAHVDHTGYLPALGRDGFRGRAVCTEGTADLTAVVLPDSGHLQEEEAAYANRKGFSKHRPARPLYTEDDARRVLPHLHPVPFGNEVEVAPGVTATFRPAGHILGSATVALRLRGRAAGGRTERTVLFSGDLGRPSHPLLLPPELPAEADVVVVESTYGDRRHDDAGTVERFGQVIARTIARGGTVVIPAFAVDRTEVVLFHLRTLMAAGAVPEVPVYVDSPLALAALRAYRAALRDRSPEFRPGVLDGDDPFDTGDLVEIRSVEESKELASSRYPSVIVSASGMATGGRVVHHLARCLPDSRNTVILVGFQAEGTRGRYLADGNRQIKMLGRYVRVRAEVVDLPALSVHADRDELVAWLARAPRPPDAVFVVHGEPDASRGLRDTIDTQLDWTAVVPRLGERVRVD